MASHHPAETPQSPVQLRWEIEGIAAVELEPTMKKNRYNVQSLWVDPEYQNLGIGSTLMRIVHHEADQFGLELWLVPQAMPGFEEALWRFYSRLGYEKFGGSGYWIRKSPTTDAE